MCALEIRPMTVTIEQAAVMLGISRSAAYRAANAGQIPTIRIGRRLLVPLAKLHELLGVEAVDDELAAA